MVLWKIIRKGRKSALNFIFHGQITFKNLIAINSILKRSYFAFIQYNMRGHDDFKMHFFFFTFLPVPNSKKKSLKSFDAVLF